MRESHRQSNLDFRVMAVKFRIRDWLRPPNKTLKAAGVRSGMTLIDFGCGPGGFAIAAARIVGTEGRVYAVDIHPLAIRSVQRAAQRSELSNIQTIHGESLVEIPEATGDIALLYDVLHSVEDAGLVLKKLHQLLKPSGMLSVSDHHLKEGALLSLITGGDLFRFTGRSRTTYEFERIPKSESAV
jgi:2-polyprenyl-3-methyl-5-hydroxy-6-metoxy-1,4-benzoquinol methylase